MQGASINIDATASARWNLYDFGRTAANVRSNERARDAVREDARTASLQALSSAATQYLTVLGDLEAIETTRVTCTGTTGSSPSAAVSAARSLARRASPPPRPSATSRAPTGDRC